MKNYIIYIISILTLLSSCTEVIDIDLNSADPQIVVEARVSTNGATLVKLSESINFDEINNFTKIEGAIVELSDNQGNQVLLSETLAGLYSSNTLTGVEGNTYSLHIEIGEKTLISQSTIPYQVAFDSLIIEKVNSQTSFGGDSKNYEIHVQYNDPLSTTNYYRFVEIVNGDIKSTYVFDDRISSGLTTNTLFSFDRNLDSGDELMVIMQCIDEKVYDYFRSFGNLSGGPSSSSSPANPYTNIEGGILGYFSAHTSETKTKIIP